MTANRYIPRLSYPEDRNTPEHIPHPAQQVAEGLFHLEDSFLQV